ncbi:MAG: heavy metal translocating P-type ATPase, partial [Chitinophagales bacterium]
QKAIKIDGMTCVNCAINIERAVKNAGIEHAVVNFSTKELLIEDFSGIKDTALEKIIQNAGFSVVKEGNKPTPTWLKDTLFWLVVIIAAYFIAQMFFPETWKSSSLDFVLGTPALIIGVWKFGKGAFYSLKAGSANMYVLILMGAITAYVFSIYLYFTGKSPLYFETTAVIIALVMVGDNLEEKAIEKTTSSLSSLAKMQIKNAKKLINGIFEEVSLNAIKKDDTVQVNQGDQIPTDGEVLEGSGMVDEALLTGESEPVFKEKAAQLFSGTTLIDGQFTYKVSKPGHLSALARINGLVQKASTEKANIQKLADKISAIFVPLIIGISSVWFFVSYFALGVALEESIIRSVAILVVSCPCAMGLATPMAVMVGIGKLSENGILVKGAQTLETFAKTKNIIFDKTGTITTGNFKMDSFQVFNVSENEAKSIILALENKSSHPIAQSISKLLAEFNVFPLLEIEEIKGSGMLGKDEVGNIYKLGSAKFTQNINNDSDIYLTKNNETIASFNIKDELKENVAQTISYLKNQEVLPVVLSGDSNKKCAMLKEELQVNIEGELKPEDKLTRIETFSKQVTTMVGDGINDAPALSKAHIGVSFSEASNIAIESADIVLLNNDFSLLQKAHHIALKTLATIRQNLFWAFAYNIVAIPLAAFGILDPMMAAFFMLFSDLFIIGNAYRFKLSKV